MPHSNRSNLDNLPSSASSMGGRARAEKMTREERQQNARRAAIRRWHKDDLPEATHDGLLEIGASPIHCAVLTDGRRVLTQETLMVAVGRAAKPKAGQGTSHHVEGEVPPFLNAKSLQPFIPAEVIRLVQPIRFLTQRNVMAYGYEAAVLPKICEIYLAAREAKVLTESQLKIAAKCEQLMRALAQVGIIALVDEATGFQEIRAKTELMQILKAYINEELLPWTERFPSEFFKEMHRVYGWKIPEDSRHPKYAARFIHDHVYDALPPGVLEELKEKNPVVDSKGRRKHRHHQLLTEDIGNPHLEKVVSGVTLLLRISDDKDSFKAAYERAYPKKKQLKAKQPAMKRLPVKPGGSKSHQLKLELGISESDEPVIS